MAPKPGYLHRRARRDSGAARLWAWARTRRGSWTVASAAEAAEITPRRARAIITAMRLSGYLDVTAEAKSLGDGGAAPAEYRLSDAGRALPGAPIMMMDGRGRIVGVRAPQPPGERF